MQAGDLIAFQTPGAFATLIRFGQRVFGRSKNYHYTHIAVVVSDETDPELVQATAVVDRVLLSSYNATPYVVLKFPGLDSQRTFVVQWASAQLGSKYGILSVIMKAINYLTPGFIRVTGERKGRMDCSVLGARAWEHGGVCFPRTTDIWQLSPSDLVDMFGEIDANLGVS